MLELDVVSFDEVSVFCNTHDRQSATIVTVSLPHVANELFIVVGFKVVSGLGDQQLWGTPTPISPLPVHIMVHVKTFAQNCLFQLPDQNSISVVGIDALGLAQSICSLGKRRVNRMGSHEIARNEHVFIDGGVQYL